MNKVSKKAEKAAKAKVEAMFYKLGNNVQINIMDLGKVARPVETMLINGGTDDDAEALMMVQIAKYRLN